METTEEPKLRSGAPGKRFHHLVNHIMGPGYGKNNKEVVEKFMKGAKKPKKATMHPLAEPHLKGY
jgi:hypothetical protein